MKLLILTQYFPPEVGAPQNRLFELAIRLQKAFIDVTVLTAMPNYPQMEIYEGYQGKKYLFENLQGLKVHRSAIYVSKNKSIVSRLKNYFSFVWSSAMTSPKLEANYDFILCESPPLFLGYSALYLARKKKAKLIFNVSDLWPESAEKLGVVTNKVLLQRAYALEAKLYKRSVLVTGQTRGICSNITNRFPSVPTYWLPNGVDLNYYDPEKHQAGDWRKKNGVDEGDFVFLYAGIIGIAQGLEVILEAAQHFVSVPKIKFVLMGSGPLKPDLIELKRQKSLSQVLFIEPVTKIEMPSVLKSVNAAIVPLKKLDLFMGAIPSKIFENLAMEVPILLGVDGEARQLFIEDGKCGLYFEPGNSLDLVKSINILLSEPAMLTQLGKNGRKYAASHFNREKIAQDFIHQLKSLK